MDNFKQKLRVVTGILINPQHQILVALRPDHVPQGGLWEFPGGKLEWDETPLDALKRELWEEVGIHVITADIFSTVEQVYEDKQIILEAWHIHKFTGEPIGKEGQMIEWISIATLKERRFPTANQEIITQLTNLYPSP